MALMNPVLHELLARTTTDALAGGAGRGGAGGAAWGPAGEVAGQGAVALSALRVAEPY